MQNGMRNSTTILQQMNGFEVYLPKLRGERNC